MSNPGYLWMPRDWLSSTFAQSLKRHDRDIYRELLDRSWLDDGLPNDVAAIASVLHEPRARFEKLWEKLSSHFELGSDGRWRNPKQEGERAKQAELQARRSDAARIANETRWGIRNGSESDPAPVSESDRKRIPRARVSPAPAPAPAPESSLASLEKSAPSAAPSPAADPDPPWVIALRDFPALAAVETRPSVDEACERWVQHRRKRRHPVWDAAKWRANFERFSTAAAFADAVHYSCVVNSYQSLQSDSKAGARSVQPNEPGAFPGIRDFLAQEKARGAR